MPSARVSKSVFLGACLEHLTQPATIVVAKVAAALGRDKDEVLLELLQLQLKQLKAGKKLKWDVSKELWTHKDPLNTFKRTDKQWGCSLCPGVVFDRKGHGQNPVRKQRCLEAHVTKEHPEVADWNSLAVDKPRKERVQSRYNQNQNRDSGSSQE